MQLNAQNKIYSDTLSKVIIIRTFLTLQHISYFLYCKIFFSSSTEKNMNVKSNHYKGIFLTI